MAKNWGLIIGGLLGGTALVGGLVWASKKHGKKSEAPKEPLDPKNLPKDPPVSPEQPKSEKTPNQPPTEPVPGTTTPTTAETPKRTIMDVIRDLIASNPTKRRDVIREARKTLGLPDSDRYDQGLHELLIASVSKYVDGWTESMDTIRALDSVKAEEEARNRAT